MVVIIKALIDDPILIRKIDSLVKSKKYQDATHLAAQAIRNLLEEETEKARLDGFSVGHLNPYSFTEEMKTASKEGGFKEVKDFINHYKKKARSAFLDKPTDIVAYGSHKNKIVIDTNFDTGVHTKTEHIDPGSAKKLYSQKSDGLIWYWHNRILPIKWLLRWILLYTIRKEKTQSMESSHPWIDLGDLRDYIEYERLPYVDKLRDNESLEYEMISRSSRLAHRDIFVGFPSIKEKFTDRTSDFPKQKETVKQKAANKRFLDQFIGKAVRVAKSGSKHRGTSPRWIASGACFEMEFMTMKIVGMEHKPGSTASNETIRKQILAYPLEPNKSSSGFDELYFQVALTPTGVKFATMENKLLDALEYSIFPDRHPDLLEIPKDELVDERGNKFKEIEVFSEKETKFIIEHFSKLERYSLESRIIDGLLSVGRKKSTGIRITMDDYHKEIFDFAVGSKKQQELKQHKSSTMGRLIELNLVYRTGKKSERDKKGEKDQRKPDYIVQPS